MKWFAGQIPEAIQEAKARNALFIVYITGEDEVSAEMNKTWEDAAVNAACDGANTLGLKIEAKSESCGQFSQFYPVVCVPSTFFIGENGVPLEVCAGHLNPAQFVEKITNASKMHQQQIAGQESISVASPVPVTSAAQQPSTSEAAAKPAMPAAPLEERVEVVKQTIAQKRAEKQEKEIEDGKHNEIERRQLGKDVSKLKEWKEDMKRKEEASEWKKDREEARLARERVKQQIAQDRAERNSQFQKEKEERHQAQQAKQAANAAVKSEEDGRRESARRERARIQFRMPDGSHITHEFSSSETLDAARQFLRPNIKVGNFQFTTTFPRRMFTEEDMQSSLLQLDLAPSAVLIVLPVKGNLISAGTGGGGGGGLSSLIWTLVGPLLLLWNFLSNILFGAPANPRGSYNPDTSPGTSSRQHHPQQSEASSSQQPSSSQSTRPKSSYGIRKRQEGNIHRFTSEDDDDESATWNGNSTQQM